MDEVFRHHIIRQGGPDISLQFLRRDLFPRIVTTDKISAVNKDIDACGFSDPFPAAHDLIDLTQFHTVAANLDHPVVAATEGQTAVFIPCHAVTGIIHALSRFERIVCKPFDCFFRHIIIFQRQPGAAHAQFTDNSWLGDQFPILVHQINAGFDARFSYGKRSACSQWMYQDITGLTGSVNLIGSRIVQSRRYFFPSENRPFQRQRTVELPDNIIHLGRNKHAGDLTL